MTEQTQISVEQAKKAYANLKTGDFNLDTNTQANLGPLLRAIKNCSEEEFVDFLVNGEQPILELSDAELESIFGGGKKR